MYKVLPHGVGERERVSLCVCVCVCVCVQEDIADLKKRSEKRDVKEWVLVILSRTVANLFVVLILIGAGTAIFRAAQLGLSSVSLSSSSTHTLTLLPPLPPSLPPIATIW